MTDTDPSVCFVCLYTYAYFEPESDLPLGGAERQLSLIGRELTPRFDVHFVVGDFGQPTVQSVDGVTLHRAYDPREDSPAARPRQVLALFRAMRRADADVYVFRGEHARATLTCALATLIGKRWVYNLALDEHAEPPAGNGERFRRAVVGRVLDAADGIIAQNERQRDRLRAVFDAEAVVVPNGCPPLESHIPYNEREFFLYVGRLTRSQKRPHLFVELARQVPDAEFVLVGPASGDEAYCEQIRREAAALDNLRFPGRVDPEEIDEYFERAIALVNTSTQEGFPNTFLEAWRAGTPVLGLDVDPGRFLGGQSTGYADGEFDELVALAERFRDSTTHRRSMGELSKREFDERYHIASVATEYAEVLQAALSDD